MKTFNDDGGVVSTVEASDGERPYETAIHHPSISGWKWIVVDAYDSWEDASSGHKAWVERLKKRPLVVNELNNSLLAQQIGYHPQMFGLAEPAGN